MNEFSWRTRRASLEKFRQHTFDVLIIGGGITGAGLALDAAVRGLKTALVEKRDFAAGTSSRSTKLIHGGLRYLEQFDFGLVREALVERGTLAKIAPHLTDPYPFVIPIYKDSRRNYDHPLKMRAGLFLYDLLAGRYNFARHRRLTREEALKLAPQLDPSGLKGAFLYYDARTNDSRLVIEVIKAANKRGAAIANYTKVERFLREGGKIAGAQLRDELEGESFEVRAKTVINATGVWMEETIRLGGENADGLSKNLRPSKGIHLTVSADRLQVDSAWLIPSLTGHRFYFVVPWEGRVNIGTTDTDYEGDKDSPQAQTDEVVEILNAINSYFPSAQLAPADVISAWAGLRPLITDPKAKDTTATSRKEELIETSDGLISLGGGKLTTYRAMAEQGIDLVLKRIGKSAEMQTTADVPIGGGELSRAEIEDLAQRISASENLPIETAGHLGFTYGSNCLELVKLIHEDESLREPLLAGRPYIKAEIVYAIRSEMAVTLSDSLTRRIRVAMLEGNEALDCAPIVAALMKKELGWNEEEIRRQLEFFAAEFDREYAATQIRIG
ncbi:MAG TPA: glycerol-3-phosphate dehydrogenase [Blastocatellia bacterium]|nr:glycerol-3-phosphate dehydrogenase [Blastocatellia bacterium]HMV84423.1 glycerol-3-phosphate dehydrogenase [Blastocatellia bacterium]HMX25988.1 glycerol-3-phosphate dehydrogenase [Blastocatellia bacterium]HMZ18112.1 glycerol-3-phosphate dehydrogenase [Blastocatellia bacterium]HNG31271.1 glycerol-3-phosphate dehydrogenase [Blastocatellia bacterium]